MSDYNGISTAELPPGWAVATLGALLHGIEAGKSFDCEQRPATADEWGVIKVSAMTWGLFDERENKAVPAGKQFDPTKEIRQNDLLVSRSNTVELVGASVLVGRCRPRLLLSDKSMRLKYPTSIFPAWLHGALASPQARQQMSLLATGTSDSMRNISQEKLFGIVLMLPPLPEQQRIVDAVDEILSDLDAGVAALKRAREKLKLYRASVLKAAVEGALTAEWRVQRPHIEPATELLECILAERRRRWEEDQLAKFKAKDKEPAKNWKAKYKDPVAPDTSNLPPLPEGWCWASTDQLCSEVRNGYSLKPDAKSGVPILRISAVRAFALDLTDVRYLAGPLADFADSLVRPRDLLFTRYNGTRGLVGVCAIVPTIDQDVVHPDKVIRARPLPSLQVPSFVALAANTRGVASVCRTAYPHHGGSSWGLGQRH